MAASLAGRAAAALAVARRRSDASPRRWRCAALLVALVAGVAGDEGQATPFDVTLVTQATTEKLWLVPELCERPRNSDGRLGPAQPHALLKGRL